MALEQLAYINFQGTGELHDIFNAEVAFPAFDSANVCPMQPRFLGKLLLRPLLFDS